MFTGIITAQGRVRHISGGAHTFACPRGWLARAVVGDSIAVNGVCLTATSIADDSFTADISQETAACCAPFILEASINLEHALRAGDSLGGHFVSGHVDGVATIIGLNPHGDECELRAQAPAELARFIAAKGAVTLHGISLTVNKTSEISKTSDNTFSVWLIPHTRRHTTLAAAKVGDKLNIEIDLIARHIARLLPQ